MEKIRNYAVQLIINVAKIFFDLLIRVEIKGKENIPKAGPAIIVANHCSYLDTPTMTRIFYKNFTRLSWVTSKENYRHWFLKLFFILYRIILVNGTVEKAKKELAQDRWVVIYPEGAGKWCCVGQKEKLKRGHGTAAIALSTGAPIIPVGLSGTDKVLPLNSFKLHPLERIIVNIGKPFSFEIVQKDKFDNALMEQTTETIMNKIAALIE